MERINPQTQDLTQNNIEQIAKLFPQVITEKEDDKGNITKAIDFDLLKQHLSKDLVDGSDERYRLDWPGKKRSILKANTPITSTLKPDLDSSENFDTTKNLYIEGDNFEVLKILQESYLGKIKMIYIDPPYNTGKDFVYKDNFKVSKEDYEDELGVKDEEGGKLVKNTDTNGRFHSDWLSMMYERLLVARDLLTDDGVIFMSIDDNEVHNLRKIGDEVFGENNFIESYVWESTFRPDNSSKIERENAQSVLLYSKNKSKISRLIGSLSGSSGLPSLTKNSMKASTLHFEANIVKTYLDDGIYKKGIFDSGYELHNDVEVKNGVITSSFKLTGKVIWGQDYLENELKKGTEIIIKSKSFVPYSKKIEDSIMAPNTIIPKEQVSDVLSGRAEVKNLMGGVYFDYPKPISLLYYLLRSVDDKNCLVLDFFSGSGSTAHAAMQLNAEDGGNRKFIMVQLPEETDVDSEAYKAGYKTIPEIGKERIRRAGKKILEENAEQLKERKTPLDVGFRVYKTAPSILKEVAKHPKEVTQANLFESQDNIREDAQPEDILTAVLLDFDITLDQSIETLTVANAQVFKVADNALVACFNKNIDMQVVDAMAKMQPIRAVFRDACFKDDKDLINTVESRFKQLSPDTKVHVI